MLDSLSSVTENNEVPLQSRGNKPNEENEMEGPLGKAFHSCCDDRFTNSFLCVYIIEVELYFESGSPYNRFNLNQGWRLFLHT